MSVVSPPSDPVCPICRQEDCDHTDDEKLEAGERERRGEPPLVLSHDKVQQQKIATANKRGLKRDIQEFQHLMKDDRFRRFMANMLREPCHINASSLNSDCIQMARMEGERNVGLFYLDMLKKHALQDYALMISEHGGSL